MTIDDIKSLIAADESRILELKKTTGELKDGMHSACAFLNTDGGWLIFGISPTGLKITGQQVTDNTLREVAQAIAGLEPTVDIKPYYVDVPDHPGNKVIAMHFDGWVWGERPHTFHGRPYYKVENTTKVMPHEMYDERVRAYRPQKYAWERQTADEVTLADLNEKHVRGCIRLGVEGGRIPASAISAPIEDTLAKWKLLKNGTPTNGAVLLFSDNINEYPQFRLRMARFLGTNKDVFIDNQRAEGNFFDLLNAGMAFFFKHLNLSGKITEHSLQREERLEVPYQALREALINSLCHRKWEQHNLTGSIAIYDDRIEIANPGVFPPQISPQSIKEPHESYPYNLMTAEVLYKSTYLESWGSGAKRIMDACREQGLEEPVWRCDGGFVTVIFKRQHNDNTSPGITSKHVSNTAQAYPHLTDHVPPNYAPSTTQVETLIRKINNDDYLSVIELITLCGLKNVKYFRNTYLYPALAEGAMERLYPGQPKHPKQKYRLTNIAKDWKDSHSFK